MMKKMLSLLAVVLMLLMPAALAEDDGVQLWLNDSLIEQLDERTVRVQLLFIKDGEAAYVMEDAELVLYDAAGEAVPVASKELVLLPLDTAPAGRDYILMTVECTLAEAAEVAAVEVLSVSGEDRTAADTVEFEWGLPYLGAWPEDCLTMTAWMPMADGTQAEDYFAVLIAVDEEGRFRGNGELPEGGGREVAAADMFDAIYEATGYTEEWLLSNGYRFEHERYVFFDNARMEHLSTVPSGFAARCYYRAEAAAAQPVVTAFDRIDMKADGSFVIHGCLENTDGGLWRLEQITALRLYDAQGRPVDCEVFSCDMPFSVVTPGEYLPYTIEGRVEPGFAAERFQLSFRVSPAEKPDHRSVEGGMMLPSLSGDLTLSATMPAGDDVDPADCFVCVMFLDLLNDDYHGAVWTYVNEAWLQDGEIRFPTMDAPELALRTDAMLTSYFTAE